MRKWMKHIIAVIGVLLLWQASAMAGEVDILVRKLVEHGVLSQKDAEEILQETRIEAEKERTATIAATKKALVNGKDAPFMLAEAVPSWIRNTQIKGDFRLRYEFKERDGSADRHRGRYRFRLGFVTKVNDKVEIGYGLASGSSDPRSTNQSFANSFETPDIRLDYAYASYRPFDWLQLIGGQMPNPLWRPSSLLWDSDIRPQGVSTVLNRTVNGIELFMAGGFWVLDEISGREDDPTMWVFQPGYKVNLGKRVYFTNALSIYEFSNVEGSALDYSSGTNTRAGGVLADDYDAYVISGELGVRTGSSFVPFAAAYGEYVNNRAISSSDSGYCYGIRIGHDKVRNPGQWQVDLGFYRLERDAWLDILPDADNYGGGTNMRAIITQLKYGLMDNVELGGKYVRSEPLSGADLDEDLFQVDLVFKF